jgi:outer membrane protein assembly factor BamB
MTSRQPLRIAAFALALAAGGCSSLPSWMPTIPAPSFDWFTGSTKAPGPLPELAPSVTPVIAWQAQVGKAAAGFAPMVTPDAIYAAAADGTVMRIDPANGRAVWRISAGRTPTARRCGPPRWEAR